MAGSGAAVAAVLVRGEAVAAPGEVAETVTSSVTADATTRRRLLVVMPASTAILAEVATATAEEAAALLFQQRHGWVEREKCLRHAGRTR